jgi:hypothetical protein
MADYVFLLESIIKPFFRSYILSLVANTQRARVAESGKCAGLESSRYQELIRDAKKTGGSSELLGFKSLPWR